MAALEIKYLPLYFIDNYIRLCGQFCVNVSSLLCPHLSFLKVSSNFNESDLTYFNLVNCNSNPFMRTLIFICIQTAILFYSLYFIRKFAYIFNYHLSAVLINSNYSLNNALLFTQFTSSKF